MDTLQRTRLVTRTTKPSVAEAAIAKTHTTFALDVDTAGPAFAFEEVLTGTDLLSLESTQCTGVVRGDVDPDDAVVVTWLKSGRGAVDGNVLLVGRPVVYRRGRQPVRWEHFQKDVLRIDRDTVEQVAAERGGWEPCPLEFKPRHVPEGAPLAAWWLMIRTVAAEVLTGPGDVSIERERDLTRYVAAGLLNAIPHWPTGQHQEQPAQSRIAKAEAFILEHVAEQIDVNDVAAAAGLSARGLQSAFQRVHGLSPTAYLRGVRLLLARERLMSGEERSVADAARAVGITHLGRFAAAFHAEFGERPRDVLRAAPTE